MKQKSKQASKIIMGIIQSFEDPRNFSARPSQFPPEAVPLEQPRKVSFTLVQLAEPVLATTG